MLSSLEYINLLFSSLFSYRNSLFKLSNLKDPTSSVLSGYVCYLYLILIFVNIDIAQFYQPSKTVGIHKDGQSLVSSLHLFMTFRPSEKGKETLLNFNQIENLDMTGLSLKKSLNPFYVSVLNFNGIEVDAESTIFLSY